MSLLKHWKLLLAGLAVAMFTACAGSSGGGAASEGGEGGGAAAQEEKKEVIDEAKLKTAETEATTLTTENHELRRQIFEAKNKLGMSTAPMEEGEEGGEEAPAEAAAE